MTNPFVEAVKTYDLLPDPYKPYFFNVLIYDWEDLEHNANPIEHVGATTREDAVRYVFGMEEGSSELDRQFLTDMIPVWDRVIEFLPPEDTTTFAGEKVSTGHYLAVRDCEWPARADDDYWVKLVFDDEFRQLTFRVHVVNHTMSVVEVSS